MSEAGSSHVDDRTPAPGRDWQFHHLGVATRSFEREARNWELLGYVREGLAFSDPIQGVRGLFLTGAGPRLELLEPLPGSTVLDGWIDRGVKIYHQAFEVRDLEATIRTVSSLGGKIVVQPVPAVAFDGRRICFMMMPTMQMLEFIELRRGASGAYPENGAEP